MNTLNSSVNTEKSLEILSQTKVLEKDFTVYGTAEEPLFLAKDVAAMIDYAKTSKGAYNVSMMLQNIDDDEKMVSKLLVSSKMRDVWMLTENGLYEVLMQSTKPIAKSFKRQVKNLLHDLRIGKTAVINRADIDAKVLLAHSKNAELLHELANQYGGKSENYRQILDAYATKELSGKFLLPLPVVTRQTYSATEIGQMIGISANKVGAIAIKYGLKTSEYA